MRQRRFWGYFLFSKQHYFFAVGPPITFLQFSLFFCSFSQFSFFFPPQFCLGSVPLSGPPAREHLEMLFITVKQQQNFQDGFVLPGVNDIHNLFVHTARLSVATGD